MKSVSFKKFAGLLLVLSLASCSYFSSDKLLNGSIAPEISLPDPQGQEISLSSMKGKIVLVEFWASWCKPCRKQNPYVVKIYDKFKDASFKDADGFTILSVSLDSDKEKWIDAIKKDNLHWPNHVSDLKMWNSPTIDVYGINSIPASYLVDQNGMIIGKDLNHRDLDKLLSHLLSGN